MGESMGESFRLGDDVEVKLVEAVAIAGALQFEMLSEGRMSEGRKAGARKGFGNKAFASKSDRTRASEGHKKRMGRGNR